MARRTLLILLLVLGASTPALARDVLSWPTRQLVDRSLERQCELIFEDTGEPYVLARRLSQRPSNEPEIPACVAFLLASYAGRSPDGQNQLADARDALARAEKLAPGLPLVEFARGAVDLATARHATVAAVRSAALDRAQVALGHVAVTASATSALRFYARAALAALAFERADAPSFRRCFHDALLAARPAQIAIEIERAFRETCFRRMGDLDDAPSILREARFLATPLRTRRQRSFAEREPRADLAEWRAWALLDLGRTEAALEEARQGHGVWTWSYLAQSHLLLRQPAQALAAARRYRNETGSHAATELVGRCLLQLDRYEEARGVFESALHSAEGADCARCEGNLARVLLGLGGHEAEAEELIARAARTDERTVQLLPARALLLRARGDRVEANELDSLAWRQATGKGDAEEVAALEAGARRALDRGRNEEAATSAAAWVAKRPLSVAARRILAEAWVKLDDRRAPGLLEELGSLPQDSFVALERGKARLKLGRLAEARQDLERACALSSRKPLGRELPEHLDAERALEVVEHELRGAR